MSLPTERVLAALEAHHCQPLQNGAGWMARCPAHEDRRPSLSVSAGEDGRALVHCHAGCPALSVCSALGLTLGDLMVADEMPLKPKRRSKPAKLFTTASEAVVSLERRHGKRSASWTYHDAAGLPVCLVVRWDTPEGKDIRPVVRDGGGWRVGGMATPRPLYRLPDLAEAKRVYICEGEKAADAARTLGLVATTSAHGAKSPEKSDWSPLAGKECVLLPDNDEPGEEYAETVEAILGKLSQPAVVRVVRLPGLPSHGDMADWVADRADVSADESRATVERLVDAVEVVKQAPASRSPDRYVPFPVDALPAPLCEFVEAGAKSIGCDPAFIALPLLSAVAAAIGTSRCLHLKNGWTAPAILWSAIVGESGSAKTPAFQLVMKPLRRLQVEAMERFVEQQKEHEVDLAIYEKALADWKRNRNTDDPPPEKPEPPAAKRYFVGDTTVEALSPILATNPRGVLLSRDELAGWLNSFDRYAGGKGGDEAIWLSLYNGETITVDRKTGSAPTLIVPGAAVSIAGGIQPAILHKALGTHHRQSGLAARFLFAYPPRRTKTWNESGISPRLEKQLADLLERLYELQPDFGEGGRDKPLVVRLVAEAKEAWIGYYDRHAAEASELSGDLAAAWSKLEETAARLALVIHCVRDVTGVPTSTCPTLLDEASMLSAIRLAEWFKRETRRVYSLLSESDDERLQRELLEWIDRKGGVVTAREVQQGHRRITSATDAEAALEELVKRGDGAWQASEQGRAGRPARRFVSATASTVYETPATSPIEADSVDVDDWQWEEV